MGTPNRLPLLVATFLSASYGGWLTYEQWHYRMFPGFLQIQYQFGWPITYLKRITFFRAFKPPVTKDHWQFESLCINSALCLVLSLAVSVILYRLVCAFLGSRNRRSFSLTTLFLVITAVCTTFPLWNFVIALPTFLPEFNGWTVPTKYETPRMIFCLIVFGLFCFACTILIAATSTVSHIYRMAQSAHGFSQDNGDLLATTSSSPNSAR